MKPSEHAPEPPTDNPEDRRVARTLFWIGFGLGVAALGGALAYVAIRFVSAGRQEDPTTQRIHELIDEANSLLKALDEQRHSA